MKRTYYVVFDNDWPLRVYLTEQSAEAYVERCKQAATRATGETCTAPRHYFHVQEVTGG